MCDCPHCGRPTTLEKESIGQAVRSRVERRHSFQSTAMQWIGPQASQLERQPDPSYTSREIETPARAASIESDVKVPLAQSVIGGFFVGATITCAWWAFGWRQPCLGPAALTFGTIGFFWTNGVREFRSLLWRVEKLVNRDLNKDGQVGQPQRRGTSLRLVRMPDGYARERVEEAPVYAPGPQEQYLDIPGMPRADTSPWTIERLSQFFDAALIHGWGRGNCKHLGVSQGQWSALKAHLEPFEVWGVDDRPTLQAFVEQVQGTSTNQQVD